MVWFVQPLQEKDKEGQATGRWRLTATSDEDGGGPWGDTSHDHPTAEEAEDCEQCDEYVSKWTGFPSRQRAAAEKEERDQREYERLKKKYEAP